MSEESPNLPSTKEMYTDHKAKVETVKQLGEIASGEFTDSYGHTLGLTEGSRDLIGSTVEAAKQGIEDHASQTAEIVSANQDIYEAQAKADMEADVVLTNEYAFGGHKANMRHAEQTEEFKKNDPEYARKEPKNVWLETDKDETQRAAEYANRHQDILEPQARKEMEVDSPP
ncbi:hypothetical protein KW794_03425, partial [Candidatus Saccharibacteria bacterium]|nr:hypothetical protein [Candidatus Saccharibacteria bacterium]